MSHMGSTLTEVYRSANVEALPGPDSSSGRFPRVNRRPGIDTDPPVYFRLVKLNLPSDERALALAVLGGLQAVEREALDPDRTIDHVHDVDGKEVGKRRAVGDLG